MNDHTEPLFRHIEAIPIIEEAVRIQTTYRLPECWNQREAGWLLGDAVGPLRSFQVSHLLETAVSRMVDNLPHTPDAQEFYVHHTIHHLYQSYTLRFLQGELQRDANLEALLTRLFERNPWHLHTLEFASASFGKWALLVDLGQVLLQREFPMIVNPGPLQNVPFRDCSVPHNWLLDVWQKLQESIGAEEPLVPDNALPMSLTACS